jgi:hypothetical protein
MVKEVNDATILSGIHRLQRCRLVPTVCAATGPTADNRKGRNATKDRGAFLFGPGLDCYDSGPKKESSSIVWRLKIHGK